VSEKVWAIATRARGRMLFGATSELGAEHVLPKPPLAIIVCTFLCQNIWELVGMVRAARESRSVFDSGESPRRETWDGRGSGQPGPLWSVLTLDLWATIECCVAIGKAECFLFVWF
jgi:hypothetical protein